MNILVLNAGSSSLKFQIIATDADLARRNLDVRLARGEVERFGREASVVVQTGRGPKRNIRADLPDLTAAIDYAIRWISSGESGPSEIHSKSDIHAVGHRVVHGGELFSESVLITSDVEKGIENCIELAPLHNPSSLEGIRAIRNLLGSTLPQVAAFDTAFHQSLPEHAYLYAIPYDLYRRHRLRRYGFHGTSHRYVAGRYQALRGLSSEETNIITLHLGNGCSAAAIRNGRPVDTSMGLTPLEGLVMGTRSGDLDPAVVSFIAEKRRMSPSEVDMLLNRESGLLGLSGLSNDMRDLLAAADNNRRAELAVNIFCYRARKYIGAYLAAMGGADAVIFTGGIGENSPVIRDRICTGLKWAGLCLDEERNKKAVAAEAVITRDGSRLAAYVIPTNEELLIARDTERCVRRAAHPG